MIILYAFFVCGFICLLAQVVLDLFNLTPGVITAIFVMLGSVLEFFNIYDGLVEFSEAGALLPITSFGHSLADSAYKAAIEGNYLNIFTGMFTNVSAGITLAFVLSLIAAIIFKPKD